MPPAQGTVRFATSRDVPAVAVLHSAAISEGFLSTLGERFLLQLYSRIVDSPHGFLLVADGLPRAGGIRSPNGRTPELAGFVAGSAEIGRLYREFLWRDGFSVALSSGAKLIASLPRVVENLRYGARVTPPTRGRPVPSEPLVPETELLALAVDGAARRHGVGSALVEGFLASAAATGSASARVVVGAQNASAIALYAGAGFTESARLELHSGTESLLMRIGLPPGAS